MRLHWHDQVCNKCWRFQKKISVWYEITICVFDISIFYLHDSETEMMTLKMQSQSNCIEIRNHIACYFSNALHRLRQFMTRIEHESDMTWLRDFLSEVTECFFIHSERFSFLKISMINCSDDVVFMMSFCIISCQRENIFKISHIEFLSHGRSDCCLLMTEIRMNLQWMWISIWFLFCRIWMLSLVKIQIIRSKVLEFVTIMIKSSLSH